MKALHALARGDDSARGDELVHYDSPKAMILTESKPWFTRWSRDASQNASGKLREAQEKIKTIADLEPPSLFPQLPSSEVPLTVSKTPEG